MRGFVEAIKVVCLRNEVRYDDVASFLISMCAERLKRLCACEIQDKGGEEPLRYSKAVLLLLDLMYFFYGVAPSVSASYKVCTAALLGQRFARTELPEQFNTIAQRMYELTNQLLIGENLRSESTVGGFISLEAINIVLAIRELGAHYLLSSETVERLFVDKKTPSYFKIVCGLFYIGRHPKYVAVYDALVIQISECLDDLSDILMKSEKCHLFLDILRCPHIDVDFKKTLLKRFFIQFAQPQPNAAQMHAFISSTEAGHWFVDWTHTDLLNALEKKELKQAY